MEGKSFKYLVKFLDYEISQFRDMDSLGIFVDNHDLPRFMSDPRAQLQHFKTAIIFGLTYSGIPYFYYGSEQAFKGGEDPANREPFYPGSNYEIQETVKIVN
jgi:alpha-amylase